MSLLSFISVMWIWMKQRFEMGDICDKFIHKHRIQCINHLDFVTICCWMMFLFSYHSIVIAKLQLHSFHWHNVAHCLGIDQFRCLFNSLRTDVFNVDQINSNDRFFFCSTSILSCVKQNFCLIENMKHYIWLWVCIFS